VLEDGGFDLAWTVQLPLVDPGESIEIDVQSLCQQNRLASDEAAYITGQVVAVNGGMYT